MANDLVQRGQLARQSFGLPRDCFFAYRERADRELGIRLTLAGCGLESSLWAEVSCFNYRMNQEIEVRGLDDDLERIEEETCG